MARYRVVLRAGGGLGLLSVGPAAESQVDRGDGEPKEKSFAATTAVGVSHCGAGCTLGDIIGSPMVVLVLGWRLFGLFLFAKYVVNYILAFVLGIAFQYYSIKPMQNLSVGEGIKAALKADTLSLTSFQSDSMDGWRSCNSYSSR